MANTAMGRLMGDKHQQVVNELNTMNGGKFGEKMGIVFLEASPERVSGG